MKKLLVACLLAISLTTAAGTSLAATKPVAVRGLSTWYLWHIGQAAAGPRLRLALGPHWRGRVVTVWSGSKHVTVRLTDWCRCPGDRVVDLDVRAFAHLADTGRGILSVVVVP